MSQFCASTRALAAITAVALAFAGIITWAGRLLASPPARFDSVIRLEFVVLDDDTSTPVKGAAVWLTDPFGGASGDGEDIATLSDDRGNAAPSRDFDLGELVNNVKDGNRFQVIGWRVKVSAEGYQTSIIPLFEYTGNVIDYPTAKVKQSVIRLRRTGNTKPDHGLKPLRYVYQDWGNQVSLVFYGEKFDALLSCPKLCSRHTPWFEDKHGTVTSVDGALRLRVQNQELIRRRDGEEHQWFVNDLVPVKWGKRQYLVPQERGIAFCNAVNLGKEPRASNYGDFPLGEGQEAVAVAGLPAVPEAWSGYLLKTSVQGEVTELLPDLIAKVNVGRKQGLRAGMELVPTEQYLFSDMEIVRVEDRESIIRPKYPNGRYRKIRVGDIVSTHRPSSKVTLRDRP